MTPIALMQAVKRPRKIPLRVVFVTSTLLQVFVAVGLTGYFSFRNGQQAVNDVATQLRHETTARVKERLQLYVDTPHLINQTNANAIDLGQLSLNSRKQERYFWEQIRTFPVITYNFYGSANGNYVGARRMPDGSLQIIRRNQETTANQYFATNSQGDRINLIQTAANFDARQRPWYQRALQLGKPGWSDVYADFSTKGLAITAMKPVYDRQGQLQGVLGSDFIFSQVDAFLQGIKIGKSGEIFIMERSGLLLATSTLDPTYRLEGEQTQRLKATDSKVELIRLTAQHLEKSFRSLGDIDQSRQLDFEIRGARQFLQVTPLQDGKGLNWLLVVVVPEDDFMGQIDANTRATVLFCLLSLGIAAIAGVRISRWIVRPLLTLNTAAKQLAKGDWQQPLPQERNDEIGELASSFNSMSEQLRESFETLEQKVEDRTIALAHSNQDLEKKNTLIRKIFGRYLSDEVVTTLLESPTGLKMGGERRQITLLTSDLRGFTAISERLPSEEVIKVLNFYLEYMADIITRYEGTIDEFMGDGILALFGAPTPRYDDTQRAIACAIAMQLAMKPINAQMEVWNLPPLEMGIGIHTGEVVVGNIGSEKRTKYGVVGSQVNLTYRIESCSVGGQVLISEAAWTIAKGVVQIAKEFHVQMKGVTQPIAIYEVSGMGDPYNLCLPQEEAVFIALEEDVPVQYVVLNGKQVGDRLCRGNLIQLSAKAALVQWDCDESGSIPDPLTSLKLNLITAHQPSNLGQDLSQDFYAKVLDQPAESGSFYIRFTGCPPDVQAKFEALYRGMALK